MNRKRKFNELYKGVFKNDKKSCLIDLKPLDKKREVERDLNNKIEKGDGKNFNNISKEEHNSKIPNKNRNRLGINLRVAKNLGFGSFFKKTREEIVDIFMSKDELISFEGLINSNNINDLFNYRDSTSKNFIDKEIHHLENTSKKENVVRNPQSYNNIANRTTELIKRQEDVGMTIINDEDEEILYEDECETIYKKRKIPQALSNHKIHFYYDENAQVNYENEQEDDRRNYFNLGNLKNFNSLKNSNMNMSNLMNLRNLPNFDGLNELNNAGINFSNLSRGNVSSNTNTTTFNQFIPTNSKNAQMMANKSLLDLDDENFALYKLKQYPKKNKVTNLLLTEDNPSTSDHQDNTGLRAIKQAIRGPLSNIINNYDQ